LKPAHKKINKNAGTLSGEIVAAFGRRFEVQLNDGKLLECVTRGKKSEYACGDKVTVQQTSNGEGVIESVDPRSSLLYRSDLYKEKLIAANIDQIVFVLAAKPSYNEELLSRCLVAAEAEKIIPLIVLNKADLVEETNKALANLAWLKDLDYQIITLSAHLSIAELVPYLQNKLSVLVGQSGMGKSTIINALVPDANARINDVSEVLDSGKHTTTNARIYQIDATSRLMDSPGLQEFGIFHVADDEIANAFREFRPYLGQCRFYNCLHLSEPGCAISAKTDEGLIRPNRLSLYQRIITGHKAWRLTQKTKGDL
jgi:ribosome biogenesis GTPase